MANPPIVIGPFDNVPAPGSPIRSDWPQEITQYVIDAATHFNANSTIRTNHLMIEALPVIMSTNSSGNAHWNFVTPFATVPNVVAVGRDTPDLVLTIFDTVTAAGFDIHCRVGGLPVIDSVVKVAYNAIGTW